MAFLLLQSVLIIGSGPIVVVKPEFDYAGSQSARFIREEGIEMLNQTTIVVLYGRSHLRNR
jgi:hypothetical protein